MDRPAYTRSAFNRSRRRSSRVAQARSVLREILTLIAALATLWAGMDRQHKIDQADMQAAIQALAEAAFREHP